MDDMQRFKETYIAECFELLEDMEERLVAMDEDGAQANNEELNAIFRCAHSIKGGAGAFGFDRLAGFTHILETLLDALREGKIEASRNVVDALLSSVDIATKMVEAAQTGADIPDDLGKEVITELEAIVESCGTSSSDGATGGQGGSEAGNQVSEQVGSVVAEEIGIYDIDFKPHEGLLLSGNEPLLILRELAQLGEISLKPNIDKVPDLNEIIPEKCYIEWSVTLETEKSDTEIKEVFEFVEDECDLKIERIAGIAKPIQADAQQAPQETTKVLPEQQAEDDSKNVESEAAAAQKLGDTEKNNKVETEKTATPTVSSIRVDIDKVDRLVNMVGELVITQSMLVAQTKDIAIEQHPKLLSGIEELTQHSRELQEAVMSVRMQPVKSIFSRMPRLVRDLSRQLEKDIRLEMFGETTEVDKTVIEQLADPLTHMIRNSVDHGIDTPANRTTAGKPPQGVIKLSAEHRGGRIVIEISDDGEGVNREKVLNRAREKGVVSQDAILSDPEIDAIIFMPGFSTAEQVSDVSGRGVGMDVVKRNIEEMGGTIALKNDPGKGSRFTISLPLTLAILDGMIIKSGVEHYIIPISNIIETLRPKSEEIRKIADGNDMLNVRGEFIPIVYLCDVFGIANAIHDPSEGLVVMLESGQGKYGLVVDELVGQQQVVIKSLEENSDPVRGISGATILGDGKVSMILDVASLNEIPPSNTYADTPSAPIEENQVVEDMVI